MSSATCYSSVVLLILLHCCQGYWCDSLPNPCDAYPHYPLYLLHQQLEAALINNSQALYTAKQAFFFLQGSHNPLVAVKACVRVGEMKPDSCSAGSDEAPAFHSNSSNDSNKYTQCWDFQWSSSILLALITADELLSFDNTMFVALYSAVGPSVHYGIVIELQVESLLCTPTKEDMIASLTTLLTWVST